MIFFAGAVHLHYAAGTGGLPRMPAMPGDDMPVIRFPPPRLGRWLAIGASALLIAATAIAQGRPLEPPLPPIRILAPEARLPVRVQRAVVRTEIVGLAAATRVELELFNPNAEELQAELQFPLLDGQVVTGFALDIGGQLRAAVPVEKVKGRQVFEDVVRARVDPALLEATQGGHHKLHVYPLPARGQRRVVLDIRESVPASARPVWRLPLRFGGAVGALDVAVQVAGVAPRALSATLGAERLGATAHNGGSRIAFGRAKHQGHDGLRVALPAAPREPLVSTDTWQDQRYFLAELPVAASRWARPAPRRVALLWDASASGAQRDHAREFAVLDAWFRQLGEVQVQLLVARNEAEPVETHAVRGGDWSALRQRLQALPYDGATRLQALQPPADADIAVLFSDGMGNWGATGLPSPAMPLVAFSSSAGAAARTLRHAAEASGGAYADLQALDTAQALPLLTHERQRVVDVQAEGARDLELGSVYPQGGRIGVAGVLTQPRARLRLTLSAPDGARQVRGLELSADGAPPPVRGATPVAVAAHRWAGWRIARLEADLERQRQAIRRLGQAFGIASTETSLLVLDTAEDYALFDVEPPPDLRAEWDTLMLHRREGAVRRQQIALAKTVERFNEKVAWWEKAFPKDAPPPPRVAPGSGSDSRRAAPAAMARPPAPAPAPAPGGAAPQPPLPGDTTIALRPWQPDEPYARRLRAARDEDLYAIYLDERPGYAKSSAFFLDVADLLVARGQNALALRVLSNLAEMDLENRHLLRILAYRLQQAGAVADALPVLEQVRRLAPDEPQSWRDLGLALAQSGEAQRAVDTLVEVVSRAWNDRFPDIDLIALAELNAIAARAEAAGRPVDLWRLDPRLRRNLPLDLRAVLSWDADNTDIDLWVIDPNGERAYYANRLTYQGGRMSRDFVGGYGPEEFSLRQAKPGTYTVKAQFYGHRQQIVAPATTLMLRLSTDFGQATQKDQDVVLRLSGRGDEVTVGTFTVGEGARP